MSDMVETFPRNIAYGYALLIHNNLPEWNHSRAHLDRKIPLMKNGFLTQAGKIDTHLSADEQLAKLGQIIKKYVPDNHINIRNGRGDLIFEKSEPEPLENTFNLAYHSNDDLAQMGLTNVSQMSICEDEFPWIIGTINTQTGNAGVVAIPSLAGTIDEEAFQRRDVFVDRLFREKQKNNWNGIIFDLRGNTGGDAEVIEKIAERLSGLSIKYADYSEVISPKGLNMEQQHIVESKEHNLQDRDYIDPRLPVFNGHVLVLQDSWNASATEGAIYMLTQMDNAETINVQTIGEATSGTFAGGCCVELPMSVGHLIIGTEYRTRTGKDGHPIREKEGMRPDIHCDSDKAFNQAVAILNDTLGNQAQKNIGCDGFISGVTSKYQR